MTHSIFSLLPPRSQLRLALTEGLLMAHRWGDEGLLHLYYLADGRAGYFAEVGHELLHDRLTVLRSFGHPAAPDTYCWHFPPPPPPG